MTARLIDTGPICYLAPGGALVWRHCRTWDTESGVISIVTELGGDGPSVTNAAEQVYANLRAFRPGCRVIEHYPPGISGGETYDEITIASDGQPEWRHIPPVELHTLLGPTLASTTPAAPVAEPTADTPEVAQ